MADARRFPERMRDFAWINSDLVPPCPFIARSVQGAVVDATERYCELIARFAADRARLCVAQMVRIRGLAAAHQAGLLGHKSDVLFADPASVAVSLPFPLRDDPTAAG